MLETVNDKTKKQIKLIIVIGIVMLLADMAATFASPQIPIMQSGNDLYMIRPQPGASRIHETFTATVKGDTGTYKKKFDIALDPEGDETQVIARDSADSMMTERQQEEYELRMITGALNSDCSARKVLLPTSLKTGASVRWHREKRNNGPFIALLTMVLVVLVYVNQHSETKRERERKFDSVMGQLPQFVNRLVLLLNAGLVLSSAFEKTAAETIAYSRNDKDYFTVNMKRIYSTVQEANGSFNEEFKNFARTSGIKELMRISNIISDNISKGVELNEKLEGESQLLWINRKKLCEERGRLAETKLTLPLVMFLMVLIVITVAPALLEI